MDLPSITQILTPNFSGAGLIFTVIGILLFLGSLIGLFLAPIAQLRLAAFAGLIISLLIIFIPSIVIDLFSTVESTVVVIAVTSVLIVGFVLFGPLEKRKGGKKP